MGDAHTLYMKIFTLLYLNEIRAGNVIACAGVTASFLMSTMQHSMRLIEVGMSVQKTSVRYIERRPYAYISMNSVDIYI